MNTKQIFLTLIVLFAIDSVALSQVKKQYRDNVHTSTTVVIKEDGANDFDILNSQFNLDDYKVNEQIKITTDQPLAPKSVSSDNVSGGQSIPPTAPDLTSATVSATPTYERPKTKMKRWSVRPKKENTATAEILEQSTTEEDSVIEEPITLVEKPSRRNTANRVKKSTSKKYRKKSKKVKKKKRSRRLKNRKHKIKRNRKLGCYKF